MLKKGYKKATLIPDRPVELVSDQDKLSFGKIVDSVVDLIEIPQRPFTFGLFGKWGTGKSTILGAIEKKLDGHGYYVVTFDAWKYEGDALRRSFLTTIANQLNQKEVNTNGLVSGRKRKVISDRFIKDLESDIYQDKSEPLTKPNTNWWKISIFIVVFVVIALAQIAYADQSTGETKDRFLQFSPLITAVIMGIAAFIINALSPTTISKLFVRQLNVGIEKLSSPEEFYKKFALILKKIEGTTLLVVIDNLDRTQKDATVQLLGTIKTFLNADRGKEDVVFLIASDHKAIKRHIKEVYSATQQDAYESEEFLKKFFNAVIEIPPFISSEYRQYLVDLLDETNIDILKNDNEDLLSLISVGYPDNPRGAKHFVNSLVVYLVMLSSIGTGDGIEDEFISKNLSFIAAVLLIRDRFSEVYDRIQEESVQHNQSWSDIKDAIANFYSDEKSKDKWKRKDYEIFYASIESWVAPDADSIKWLFNMRRSREEQSLPNWDSFVSSVDKKDQEKAVNYLQEFYSTQPITLNRLLEEHGRDVRLQYNRWTSLAAAFLGFITTRSDQDSRIELKGALKNTFRYFPKADEFAKFVNQVDLQKLLEILNEDFVAVHERAAVRTSLNGYLRNHISEDGIGRGAIQQIFAAELSALSVNVSTTDALADAIAETSSFYEDQEIINNIRKLQIKRKQFVTSDLMSKIVDTITDQDLQSEELLKSKLEVLNNHRFYQSTWTQKYVDLMNWLQATGDTNKRAAFVPNVYDYFRRIKRDGFPDLSYLNVMTNYLYEWYMAAPDYDIKKKFMSAAMLFGDVEGNGYVSHVDRMVEEFFTSAPLEHIKYLLLNAPPSDRTAEIVRSKLQQRIFETPTFVNELGIGKEGSKWYNEDHVEELALYLADSLKRVDNENKFAQLIEVATGLHDIAKSHDQFQEKIYEAFGSKADEFTELISKFVYKKKSNLLDGREDWLLDLKRKIRDAKDSE